MATANKAQAETAALDRFTRDLDALVAADATIGVAVSGGPDSIALLLLAAEARPLKVEAATVDHALRAESSDEARMVAQLCEQLGVPHSILTATWEALRASPMSLAAPLARGRSIGTPNRVTRACGIASRPRSSRHRRFEKPRDPCGNNSRQRRMIGVSTRLRKAR